MDFKRLSNCTSLKRRCANIFNLLLGEVLQICLTIGLSDQYLWIFKLEGTDWQWRLTKKVSRKSKNYFLNNVPMQQKFWIAHHFETVKSRATIFYDCHLDIYRWKINYAALHDFRTCKNYTYFIINITGLLQMHLKILFNFPFKSGLSTWTFLQTVALLILTLISKPTSLLKKIVPRSKLLIIIWVRKKMVYHF